MAGAVIAGKAAAFTVKLVVAVKPVVSSVTVKVTVPAPEVPPTVAVTVGGLTVLSVDAPVTIEPSSVAEISTGSLLGADTVTGITEVLLFSAA